MTLPSSWSELKTALAAKVRMSIVLAQHHLREGRRKKRGKEEGREREGERTAGNSEKREGGSQEEIY